MTDKLILQLTEKLKSEVQKDFGKTVCRELTMDCASCQAQVFIGYLNWYMDTFIPLPGKVKLKHRKR